MAKELDYETIQLVLQHIQSLGYATVEQIGQGRVLQLVKDGLIEQIWINTYALTETGEKKLRHV